jgi:hypothetical protein
VYWGLRVFGMVEGGEEDTQGFPFFFFAQKGKNRIFANYMTKIEGRP